MEDKFGMSPLQFSEKKNYFVIANYLRNFKKSEVTTQTVRVPKQSNHFANILANLKGLSPYSLHKGGDHPFNNSFDAFLTSLYEVHRPDSA